MKEYTSYDYLVEITKKYGTIACLKQKPQDSSSYIRSYIVYEENQGAQNAIDNGEEIKMALGDQITLQIVRINQENLKLGTKGPYIVDQKGKTE